MRLLRMAGLAVLAALLAEGPVHAQSRIAEQAYGYGQFAGAAT